MSILENKSFTYLAESVMSNADHTIEEDVAKELKKGSFYAQYAGWNFCGYVWWNENKWSCEIWQYNSHIDTVQGDTLQEIMDKVSEEYGYE